MNSANVTHDANGSLTGFGSESYTWDVRGRLSGLTKPGLTVSYGYDPSGLRMRQTVNGTTTTFLLNGGSVVSESTGGVARHTLQGPFLDQPLARDGKYFTPNHLGSTTTLTDGSGNTVQQYSYQPFGQVTESPSPGDSNPYRFTGREDDETGLHHFRARYYRPEWGRCSFPRLGSPALCVKRRQRPGEQRIRYCSDVETWGRQSSKTSLNGRPAAAFY